ncbi:MAG: arginine decarboxylase, partial [Thermoprotei archaeon]
MTSGWGIEESKKLYNLNGSLKKRFFDIDREGYLVLKLGKYNLRVYDLVAEYGLVGAYIRVLPFIREVMDLVYATYKEFLEKYKYRGDFIPVYPLKANSNKLVVDTIYRHGSRYRWGFNLNTLREVELIESYVDEEPRIIVVDGVKSRAILEKLRIFAEKGWKVIVDIEGVRDAEILSDYSIFAVGLRLKYLSGGEGPWRESVGLDSKFGLSLTTLFKVVAKYDWIYERAVLLHMHPGSQIHRFEEINGYFVEAANIYNELKKAGFKNLEFIDFGGGLSYPYHESRLSTLESPDYGLHEYAEAMVKALSDYSKDYPGIVFESGRFITALHRIVVSKVLEVRPYDVYLDNDSISVVAREAEGLESFEELEEWLQLKLGSINSTANKHVYGIDERIRVEKI